MSRPFTRSQAAFLTPVKDATSAPVHSPQKPKQKMETEVKKEVKRNLDFTPIVIPDEVKEVCLCGQDCQCQACYYEFYAERNQIHHDHSDKGEICYGTECKMCPYSVITEQWDWEAYDNTDESCETMGTARMVKSESDMSLASTVEMNDVPDTTFWKLNNQMNTRIVSEEYDSETETDTSSSESSETESSDSDSDSDYVPSETESDSDIESDAESQDWAADDEYSEDCQDILTSQMLDLYGSIYHTKEQLNKLNQKSNTIGQWTPKMDTKYENLMLPLFKDEWYNEIQRMRKTLGKYSNRTHMRMIYEMDELIEEISTL